MAGILRCIGWKIFCADPAPSAAYTRKDFYKIILATDGHAIYHFADQHRSLRPEQAALVFTNTHLPYSWEILEACRGCCCLFTADFLPTHAPLNSAALGLFTAPKPFFYLTPAQAAAFGALFEKMLTEQDSTYLHKYELLFHYVMACAHEARGLTAATRLAALDAQKDLAFSTDSDS